MTQEILLPVSRMIGGSVYSPQLQFDDNKQPVIDVKTGHQVSNFNIGIAIPKAGEDAWAQTAWGTIIKGIGDAAYPGQSLAPSFSWKIIDGDSQIPNKSNNRPCDQTGYAGHWIIWMTQRWAPVLCDLKSQPLITEGAIMPGDWVQAYVSVAPNQPRPGKSHTPGVYINPLALAFVGYHTDGRIVGTSVDVKTITFGQGPMPAGISATPVGHSQVTAVPTPAPYNAGDYANKSNGPAQTPPPPNHAIYQPPPPPAPVDHLMTAAAGGFEYAALIAAGWTDETLRAAGMML